MILVEDKDNEHNKDYYNNNDDNDGDINVTDENDINGDEKEG